MRLRREGRKKRNKKKMKRGTEGLVCKSNGILPMNFSYHKGESFDSKGIGSGERGRSKVIGLKEKSARGFSRGITLGFFNSSNQARVLARSSH